MRPSDFRIFDRAGDDLDRWRASAAHKDIAELAPVTAVPPGRRKALPPPVSGDLDDSAWD